MEMKKFHLNVIVGIVFIISNINICYGNVVDFGLMIKEVTGVSSLSFNDYGNWCGLGGSGPVVDRIDACCHNHDLCYRQFSFRPCVKLDGQLLDTHLTKYEWKMSSVSRKSTQSTKPISSGSSKSSNKEIKSNFVTCTDRDPCRRHLCECDKMAATCFRNNLQYYSKSYQTGNGDFISQLFNFLI